MCSRNSCNVDFNHLIYKNHNYTILCARLNTVHSLKLHLFQICFHMTFLPVQSDKVHENWRISPGIRTVQLQNISPRVFIIQILTVFSMQNLECESVMGWLSLMRHMLAWWPKTPVSRKLWSVIRTVSFRFIPMSMLMWLFMWLP